eukprot:scaffold263786_cov36-Tisochrysis_lutea.AAC.3
MSALPRLCCTEIENTQTSAARLTRVGIVQDDLNKRLRQDDRKGLRRTLFVFTDVYKVVAILCRPCARWAVRATAAAVSDLASLGPSRP